MIVTALFLLSASVAPTLDQITTLAPGAAGEVILAGRDHRAVVKLDLRPTAAPMPWPTKEVWLTEVPARERRGCVRYVWEAMFDRKPETETASAGLGQVTRNTEIALPTAQGCPADGYAHINPGISPSQGFSMLARLTAIRTARTPDLSCVDETQSGLCSAPQRVRHALAGTPVQLTLDGSTVRIYLDQHEPDSPTYFEVRISTTGPLRATLRWAYIPPF